MQETNPIAPLAARAAAVGQDAKDTLAEVDVEAGNGFNAFGSKEAPA